MDVISLLCLFIPLFLHFSFSNFQTLKLFITLFSGIVRARRLKLGTHVVSGQMYRVYWNQAGLRQANLVLSACASSEGSGEPAHPRSLARTFAARSYKQ